MRDNLGPAFEEDSNVVFFNASSRADWVWRHGLSKDLVLVYSGRWLDGAVMTREAFTLYSKLECGVNLPISGTPIAPDAAAYLYDFVWTESDIEHLFEDEGPRAS